MAGRADTERQVSGGTSHSSHDEPVSAGARVGIDRAADDRAHVLGRLVAERRRAGRQRQVVVDRFRNMDVGDRILFGCQEFGDAVRSRSRIVASDGHQQLNVVFDEQVEVEIFFEVFVRRFETTHRQERSAAVEDVVGQQEVDLGDFRRVGEQSGISAVQSEHPVSFL